jgi:hypothetical protein
MLERTGSTARLLIELSRPNPNLGILYDLLQGEVDWVYVLAQAERHSITPLLFGCLSRMRADVAPPEIFEQLLLTARTCTLQSLRHAAALYRVIAAFETRGIPIMAFKGPVNAWSLYPNPGLRQMGDLDLLVRPDDAARAVDTLTELGCKAAEGPAPASALWFYRYVNEMHFVTPEEVNIDLHWQLGPIHFERWFDVCAVWSRKTCVSISGRLVPTLGREDHLRFLCMHAAKHGWFSLRDLSDLARLIALGVDYDVALSEAGRSGGVRTLLLGLGIVRDVLGEILPAHVNERIAAEPCVRKLLASAKRTLLAESVPADSATADFRHGWSLLERPADRARLCWGLMQPNTFDWEWCPLPAPLRGAYFLLRPIRLAVTYLVRPYCRFFAW